MTVGKDDNTSVPNEAARTQTHTCAWKEKSREMMTDVKRLQMLQLHRNKNIQAGRAREKVRRRGMVRGRKTEIKRRTR